MRITAVQIQETPVSVTIDVAITYTHPVEADEDDLYRCRIDLITNEIIVFNDGQTRRTTFKHYPLNDASPSELQEAAILAAICFPSEQAA